MRTPTRLLILAAAGAALSGCMGQIDAPLSSTFGEALASMDNQIIDPTVAEGIPESSAARAARGVTKYDRGLVTEPPGPYKLTREQVNLGNSDGSGGEGAGGSGSGSSQSGGSGGSGDNPAGSALKP